MRGSPSAPHFPCAFLRHLVPSSIVQSSKAFCYIHTHTHTHKALLHNPAHYPIVAFVRSLSLRPTEHRRRCILLTVVNRRRRSVLCRSSCTIVWGQLCILLKKERKRIKPKTRGNDVSIGEKSGSAVARARARCQQIRVANFSSLVLRRDGLARA